MGIGAACVVAAIVGGGLEAVGIKFPVVSSIHRQILMAIFGLAVFALGWVDKPAGSPSAQTPPNNAQTGPPSPATPEAESDALNEMSSAEHDVRSGPQAPPQRPNENIGGMWRDANGQRSYEVRQQGARFSFESLPRRELRGGGEIEGRSLLFAYRRASEANDQYTCSGAVSADGRFITGQCQSMSRGNAINGFRWVREPSR
jgi:hypothetical protein